jgi:hypothetical protein
VNAYSRGTEAASELRGQPVNTWSEDWQHETEARAILKMSKEEQDAFFSGRRDENGKTVGLGVIGIRGPQAAAIIRATMERLQAVRDAKR